MHFSKICHFEVSPNEVSVQNKSFRGHVCRVHALETVMEYNILTEEQILAIRQSQGYTDVPNQCGFWSGSGRNNTESFLSKLLFKTLALCQPLILLESFEKFARNVAAPKRFAWFYKTVKTGSFYLKQDLD